MKTQSHVLQTKWGKIDSLMKDQNKVMQNKMTQNKLIMKNIQLYSER